MSQILLITGGARSGKSLFAEKYAAKYGKKVAYIATAQVLDKEMEERVALHQNRRPSNWETFEAPYNAHEVIESISADFDTILFDCLTLYTSNLMFQAHSSAVENHNSFVMNSIDTLLKSVQKRSGIVLFVTNEVGMGIVPDNALSREYRDLAGMVNQRVSRSASQVYLVVSGLAVDVKKLAMNIDEGV